ncbi:EAL domain-containing protein [Pontibacterium granulatum]|uniref:EAL domain-containing protein n=1 Tax=Pontibacterium granulatum TaxID=2036029 RepID=UPI00249A36FD|nr:EAL domain-containing protein [Pontibacterium granulatum]MDI3325341.1 EAL domain-containing protein [Pontibacterium granulatum]
MDMELFPWYQPIVETASGRIAGYEALARTQNEQGEVVSAGAYFADCSIDLEKRINADRHVRYQALSALHEIPGDSFVSINLSPEWLHHVAKTGELPTLSMLEELQVDPSRVMIEITELSGDLELICQAVSLYRAAGFKIAIDDFGADFSQLDRVALLMPDVVKLDMKLLRDGLDNPRNASMIQVLGEMASRLGAKVLCEGVETEEAYFLALTCNAYYMQGFLFSQARAHALPVEQFSRKSTLLRDSYRDMALDSSTRSQWLAQKVSAELVGLREQIRAKGVVAGVIDLEHYLPTGQMLRFYICDRTGTQISPNYENRSGAWKINREAEGSDWSWRPYFIELMASDDIEQRLVFSEPYHDIYAGELSQTAALLIDESHILLADLRSGQVDGDLFHNGRGMRARSIDVF